MKCTRYRWKVVPVHNQVDLNLKGELTSTETRLKTCVQVLKEIELIRKEKEYKKLQKPIKIKSNNRSVV